MTKIIDFGEKIGGARKDLWKINGIQEEDLEELTQEERDHFVNRDIVWPLPNAKKLVEEGADPFIVFWQREIRRCIHKIPVIYKGEDKLYVQKMYVKMANKIKIATMSITNTDEFIEFYQQNENNFGDREAYFHTAYKIAATKYSLQRMWC